jgi:hypothetical protein
MESDELMRRLEDADPLDSSSVEQWKRSGRPSVVLDRVLVSVQGRRAATPQKARGRRFVVWAAVAAAAVVLTVGLSVSLWKPEDTGMRTAGAPAVDRAQALSGLVAWTNDHILPGAQTPLARTDPVRRFLDAAGREVIGGSGGPSFVDAGVTTWGDAVGWVRLILGERLSREAVGVPAAGAWHAPEAETLVAMIGLGLLPPGAAKAHDPDDPLSRDDWEALLQRLTAFATRSGH